MKYIVIFNGSEDPPVVTIQDKIEHLDFLTGGYPYAESTEDLPKDITFPDPLDIKVKEDKVTFSWQGFQVEHRGYYYPVIVEYFNKDVRIRQVFGLRCKYKVWAEIATLWLVDQVRFMREDSVRRWKTRVIDV